LDIAVKQFSVIDAIAYPGTERDPLLKEFSEVLIFSSVTAVQNETLLDQSEQQKTKADSDRTNFDNLNELEQMLAIERVRKEEAEKAKEAEEEQELFDRQTLLEPVIAKLRSQARKGEDVQLVSISGAVFAPGTYPLFSNATAVDLIAAAGGLKDSAFASSAELRSLQAKSDGGMAVSYQELNLDQAMNGIQNPRLSSRDHITVRDIPDWSPRDQITISGEVKFPGSYLIQPGETLSDVIQRAGGLTEEAFAEAAVFTREEIAKREAERSSAFAADIRQTYASRLLTEETTSNTLADIAEITRALETFEGRGRMLIDLPLALAGNAAADLEVTDGDTLVIPKRVNTVTVVGEVYQQGTHTFASGNRLEDYLSLSAGLTARADDKAIYVVKANGSVAALDSGWWRFGGASQQLAPGDTIVVPVNSQYKESLASWREITQIVYQSIISVAAVANL
jgi:polysaccharide export outer membrane protein